MNKKVTDFKLTHIKYFINILLDPKSAIDVVFQLLQEQGCNTVEDLIKYKDNLIRKLYPDIIFDKEFYDSAYSDIKGINGLSTKQIKEMTKQHIETWKLIFMDRLYVFENEKHDVNPQYWGKRAPGCADIWDNFEYTKQNVMVTLNYKTTEYCSWYQEEAEHWFALVEFKYPELIQFVKPYILDLPKGIEVKDLRPISYLKKLADKYLK